MHDKTDLYYINIAEVFIDLCLGINDNVQMVKRKAKQTHNTPALL